MNALMLLKEDHRTVEQLFKQFEQLKESGGTTGKKGIVAKIVKELQTHARIEETIFYPAVRAEVEDTGDSILEALEEHHIVKRSLEEISELELSDERLDAKVTVLMELVRHHVEEEEKELFPEVRKALGKRRLDELGAELERAKRSRGGGKPRATNGMSAVRA